MKMGFSCKGYDKLVVGPVWVEIPPSSPRGQARQEPFMGKWTIFNSILGVLGHLASLAAMQPTQGYR